MVRNEKVFFPPHEYVLPLGEVTVGKISTLGLSSEWFPRRKPRPVVYVCFFVGAPFLVASLKSVLSADDLSFKKCGQGWMIFCESYFTERQVATVSV